MAAVSKNIPAKWPNSANLSPFETIPLEAFPAATAVVDPEGILLQANSAWRAAHPAALEGTSALEWCGEALRRDLHRAIQRAAAGAQPRSSKDYIAGDGASRRVLISST